MDYLAKSVLGRDGEFVARVAVAAAIMCNMVAHEPKETDNHASRAKLAQAVVMNLTQYAQQFAPNVAANIPDGVEELDDASLLTFIGYNWDNAARAAGF